jgi:hypothetical protein
MQQIYTETKICLPSELRLTHENLRMIWDTTIVSLANGQAYHLNLDHRPSKYYFLTLSSALVTISECIKNNKIFSIGKASTETHSLVSIVYLKQPETT